MGSSTPFVLSELAHGRGESGHLAGIEAGADIVPFPVGGENPFDVE